MTPLSSTERRTFPWARSAIHSIKWRILCNSYSWFTSGEGLPASRLASPQTILQPHRLWQSHFQVNVSSSLVSVLMENENDLVVILIRSYYGLEQNCLIAFIIILNPGLTGAGTSSTACPSTAAWPRSSKPPWAFPPSSTWSTTTPSPPTRTPSTTGERRADPALARGHLVT